MNYLGWCTCVEGSSGGTALPKDFAAFARSCSECVLQLRSCAMVTPKYLQLSFCGIGCSLMVKVYRDGLGFKVTQRYTAFINVCMFVRVYVCARVFTTARTGMCMWSVV